MMGDEAKICVKCGAVGAFVFMCYGGAKGAEWFCVGCVPEVEFDVGKMMKDQETAVCRFCGGGPCGGGSSAFGGGMEWACLPCMEASNEVFLRELGEIPEGFKVEEQMAAVLRCREVVAEFMVGWVKTRDGGFG